jgi:hypothetical protein
MGTQIMVEGSTYSVGRNGPEGTNLDVDVDK